MWSQYDENLLENPFFQTIHASHNDIIERCAKEKWIMCIPRVGTLEGDISIEIILDHILVLEIDHSYSTLSKKHISVCNKHIHIESSQLFTGNTEILFEETFYIERNAKYTVWCLDRPLFLKYDHVETEGSMSLDNLHDCIDFLWAESSSHCLLDDVRDTINNFLLDCEEFEGESLQTQKELIGNLYSQCLQVVLKNKVMKDKCSKSRKFLENLKISVETYMQYCLRRKLVFSVNTLLYQTDSLINKITRNSSEMQLQDLEIPDTFCDVVVLAKCELNKLNNYVTVLDKIFCLKRTFNIIYDTVKDAYITSDDFLQILIFLMAKLNLSNWAANLTYIKEFRFSLFDNTDQNSFVITSLEAAIEFIRSNRFLEIRNKSLKSSVCLKSSSFSVESLFTQMKSKQIESFKAIESESSSVPMLCHPLCSCDKCKNLKDVYDRDHFDVQQCNEKRQSLLILATLLGDCDMVEILLSQNFDVNLSDCSDRTALHYAALRGHQDILLLLIASGADVNVTDADRNMPLHLAANNGHENCVKALIYSSCEVELNVGNFFGDTPLHLATRWGYIEIIRILLENGSSIIIQNKRNQTVLDGAPNYYVLKLLKDFGVHRSVKLLGIENTNENGTEEKLFVDDCREHGIKAKNFDQRKKVDLLLKAIENNDLPLTCFYLGFACDGLTQRVEVETCHPLCDCENCQNDPDDFETVSRRRPPSININTCNATGYTPLHVAAKFGRSDILRLLLDCGALPNTRTYKSFYAPLHLACIFQRVHVVRELVKCGGCDIDAQDFEGNTPLFYACAKNDVKTVEILLSNGADCNRKNYSGRSVLQESEENKQYRVFKLLKNSFANSLVIFNHN